MPLLELSEKAGNPTFVGETEFIDPENESEQVKIYIYMAKPEFDDQALQADFSSVNQSVLKDYVRQFSAQDLKRLTEANGGKISFKLDGTDVTLARGTHFFYSNKDRKTFAN